MSILSLYYELGETEEKANIDFRGSCDRLKRVGGRGGKEWTVKVSIRGLIGILRPVFPWTLRNFSVAGEAPLDRFAAAEAQKIADCRT